MRLKGSRGSNGRVFHSSTRKLLLISAGVLCASLWRLPAAYSHNTLEWALDGAMGWDQNPGYLPSGPGHSLAGGSSASSYAGGSLFYTLLTPTLRMNLAGTAGYLKYFNSAYPSHTVASIDGQAQYTVLPRILFWNANETYGQATTNVLAGPSTLNSTNINMFSTGPELIVPITYLWHFRFTASAGRTIYQSHIYPNDTRVDGSASLVHDISRYTNAALEGTYEKIMYSSSGLATGYPYSSYSLEAAYAHWSLQGFRNNVGIDVGEGFITQAGRTTTSPMIHLNFQHRFTPHLNGALLLAHDQTDTAAQFSHSLIYGRLPTSLNNLSYRPISQNLINGPVQTESVVASATWMAPRTQIEANTNYSQNHYVDNSQWNSVTYGVGAYFLHRLTRHLDIKLNASEERNNYASLYTHDTTLNGSALVGWHVTRDVQLSFGYRFERRSANHGGYSYTDNSIYVGIRFSPFSYVGFSNSMPTSFSGVGGTGPIVPINTPSVYY